MVFVLLAPSTVEDEGRYHYLGAFGSERQADKFILEQVFQAKGYYGKDSYIKAKRIG